LQNEDATLQDDNHAVASPQPIPTSQSPSAELLIQVVQHIVNNLNVDLSDSTLARRFSLEEDKLLAAFQSHTGIALDQFVLRRRIERALYVLKHSNSSDIEIAAGVGWGSAPAFQAAFSSYLGVSPTEYRRSLSQRTQGASGKRHRRASKPAGLPREESYVIGRFGCAARS